MLLERIAAFVRGDSEEGFDELALALVRRQSSRRRATARLPIRRAWLALFLGCLLGASISFAGSVNCESWNGIVDRDITFESACVYRRQVTIAKSGVELDCNGGFIDGGRTRSGPALGRWDGEWLDGIVSGLRFEQLAEVTIRNCTVQNFYGRGINLAYVGRSYRDAGYGNSPRNVRIIDSTVWYNYRSGLYINAWSTGFVVHNSRFAYNGGVGIYLERESRLNTIRGSKIYQNSGDNPPWKQAAGHREGIAVDSSSFNGILDNEIYGNAGGGIKLYRNCGEDGGVTRIQGSHHNRIAGNTIKHHETDVGVHVASRQLAAEGETGVRHCSDTPVMVNGVERYRDHARDNVIAGNTFVNNRTSIKIDDDFNQVLNNSFTSIKSGNEGRKDIVYDVAVGNRFRQALDDPVRGILIEGNETRSVSSNRSGRTMVVLHGSEPFVEFKNNRTVLYQPRCSEARPARLFNPFYRTCRSVTDSCDLARLQNSGWWPASSGQCE